MFWFGPVPFLNVLLNFALVALTLNFHVFASKSASNELTSNYTSNSDLSNFSFEVIQPLPGYEEWVSSVVYVYSTSPL